jgi:hypothetical protein
MNLAERIVVGLNLQHLQTGARPSPATLCELLNDMEQPLSDWVIGRPGPTMAFDAKPLPRSTQPDLTEALLLSQRQNWRDRL